MSEKKVILTAAITGAVHIPSMSPYLPITPEQIIDEAVAACQAGAAVVHLHTRDPRTGQPTGDPELMQQVVDGVRARCGVVIGITTGGAIGMTSQERLAALPTAHPDVAAQTDRGGDQIELIFSGRCAGPDKLIPQDLLGGLNQEVQIGNGSRHASHDSQYELEVNGGLYQTTLEEIGDIADHAGLIYLELRLDLVLAHDRHVVLDILEGVGEGHLVGVLHKGDLPVKFRFLDLVSDGGEAEIH